MEFRSPADGRLDALLAEVLDTRTTAQRLIKAGAVRVNDLIVSKPAFTVEADDLITVDGDLPAAKRSADSLVEPTEMDIPILYDDAHCMVINKPAGISVHPGHSSDPDEATLLHGLAALFARQTLDFVQGSVLVHRLDKETSGCLLVAKTPADHRLLQAQFKDRAVEKYYLALVCGTPVHQTALIDASIGRHTGDRTKMTVTQSANSRDARTEYTVLSSAGPVSLLRCQLYTGRTHQIRVHLQSIGHPLLGDSKYGTSDTEALSQQAGLMRLWLHAEKLCFVSPSGKNVTVLAPLPAELTDVLAHFGLSAPPA